MGSVLHGSARTTPRIRAELQASQESTRSLAVCYRLNPKTVAKWRKRPTTADAQMGPKAPKSTVLTPAEEAMAVAFRQKTLLPLDDVLGCLKDTIPNLSRSALHRCLQRHGISRLPVEGTKTQRKRFKTYEIGYVHIDSCELRHADGRLVMFLAIDRVSKFTYVEFRDSAGKMEGAAFLRNVAEAFPCQIHTVLTDNGMAFADLPKNRDGPSRRFLGPHIFDRVCREHGIEHRLTKPYHPWTNGQAERMNRTVKDATIKAFHYDNIDSLKAHVLAFVAAYNFAKHLKALRWKTPYRVICDAWTKDPSIFKINPNHLIPGPHNATDTKKADRLTALGYTGIKVGFTGIVDLDLVARIRDHVGPKVDLMVDAHGPSWMTAADAIAVGRELGSFDLLFYEDPVAPEDMDALARVRDAVRVPLAAGERVSTIWGIQPYIDRGLVDVIQPDTGRAGGITQMRKMAAMAEGHYITMAPHSGSLGPVAEYAALHVMATIPNALMLERVEFDWEGRNDVITPAPQVVDGHLKVPDTPGLGVDIIVEEIEKYPSRRNVRDISADDGTAYVAGTAAELPYFQTRFERRLTLRRSR